MSSKLRSPLIKSPWKWFAVILLVSLILKFSLLFTSQSYLDGDDALIGIMAKHILEKGARPISIYGSSFMGGSPGVAEPYLGAISFGLFGVSGRSLRTVAILLSTSLLLAIFLFMKKNFDGVCALVASSLFAISPSFVPWGGVKPTGGYVLSMLFAIILLHGVYRALDRGRITPLWAISLGLIGGLGLWNHPTIIPALIATLIALLLIDIRFPLRKEFFLFWAFFFLGTAPAIGIQKVFLKLLVKEQILTANPLQHFLRTFFHLWTQQIPLIFCPYQEQSAALVYGKIPIYGWVFYIVFLLALSSMIKVILSIHAPRTFPKKRPCKESILLLYLAVFFLFYCISRRGGGSPRYLMPAFPIVLIIMSIFIGRALVSLRRPARLIALSVFALLVILGLGVYGEFIRKDPEVIAAGLVEKPRSGYTIPKTISFLNEQNIYYVLSMDHLTEWQINFESREKTIACRLDKSIRYMPYARLLYAETVKRNKPYAFVWPRKKRERKSQVHKAEVSFNRFLEENSVSYNTHIINGEIAVYHNFSRNIAEHMLLPFWNGEKIVWLGEYPPLPPLEED